MAGSAGFEPLGGSAGLVGSAGFWSLGGSAGFAGVAGALPFGRALTMAFAVSSPTYSLIAQVPSASL
ncbi:hypothetical protein D3C72_2056910 [compost metagenome]